MAGSPERPEKGIPEKIREIMVQFDVDEKQARQLLGCGAMVASEIVAKWKSNLRMAQMQKAAEILALLEKAKTGDFLALAGAESKLRVIVERSSWER